ncbi:unnamed protein product, partial [Schistosoma curassoni]|uniref:DUF1758 domain-containing protein n=1 Tax=Schistosoma curassoni TaxID=6186 RepID=A0A183JUI6_9TREM
MLRPTDAQNMKGDSIRNHKANHEGECKFGKCLSCGKFHSPNSCVSPNAKCFKYDKIEHIQSVCKTTVHFTPNSTKPCNLDPVDLTVPNDHLFLSTISKSNAHIQRRLYTSLGSFHDLIVDTGSIEPIVPFENLESLDPNIVVRPTEASILGITGHRLPIRRCCESLIRDDNSSHILCEFLVSETGLSILKRLKVELCLLVSKEHSDDLLKDLIAACTKYSGVRACICLHLTGRRKDAARKPLRGLLNDSQTKSIFQEQLGKQLGSHVCDTHPEAAWNDIRKAVETAVISASK